MKTLQSCLLLFAAILLCNGCQNELNYEPSVTAQGSLHDSNGNCYLSVVDGIYTQNSILTTANFIDANILQVNDVVKLFFF